MVEPLGIGVIGAGVVAQVGHLPAYQRVPSLQVRLLCDVDPGKARAVAQRFGIPRVCTSSEEFLRDPGIAAVDICTPNDSHLPIALAAFAVGKDVLVEKPLAVNGEEAEKMVRAAEASGRHLVVALNHRFRSDAALLKAAVDHGEVGEVRYVRCGWLRRRGARLRQDWTESRRRAGGGALIDLGIQPLDLALWLLGYPQPRRVSGMIYVAGGGREVEDAAVALCTFEGGATVSVEVSWDAHIREDQFTLSLHGTRGSATLEPLAILRGEGGRLSDITPPMARTGNVYMDSFRREIEFFSDVLQGKAPSFPLAEQVVLMKLLDHIYRSARGEGEVLFS